MTSRRFIVKQHKFISCRATLTGLTSLALTEALALDADIVAQERAEDEVFLGRELVERAGDDETYGIQAFPASEIDVDVTVACRLKDIVNLLALQPLRDVTL